MYVFIAIIFIAELIISITIINYIRRINQKVLTVGEQMIETGMESIRLVKSFKAVLLSAQAIMSNTVSFIALKKRQLRQKIINLILIYLILFIFKTKFKKAAEILQYLFVLRDLWLNIPI